MNLCLVCRDVSAHAPSGLVRATCDLADTLAEAGHSVHLLSDRSPLPPPDLTAASFVPLTVPVASGPFRNAAPETARHNLLYAAAVYREVRRIHEREQPVDAVVAPLWRSEGAVCLLDQRFPTVVSCMTSLRTMTEIDGSYVLAADVSERLSLEREALRRARYLHGLTEADLSKTVADYQLAPVACAVISRGIRDRAGKSPRPRETQSASDESSRPAQLLFVGRIERRKGVDTLIAAVRALLGRGIDVNLTLAGPDEDPSIRERFEAEAADRPQLRSAVQFAGAVPDTTLEQLYAEADIVCIPSRYESHGIVLIEAMMFGKAIATSDAGGINEVVEADRNAVVSPPEDAAALTGSLRRLLSDRELRMTLAAEAHATFQRQFEAREVARRMASFLEEVVEIHRTSTPPPRDVREALAELLRGVIEISPEAAAAAAAELLDPAAGEPLRRLRAAARGTTRGRPSRPAGQISAIVVTRNRAELLERALDSLEASDARVETIVIDNASTPAHARRVSQLCDARKGVRLRRSDVNLGTAGGRQLAIDLADSDLVLFLDDDAELMPGALDYLLRELDEHPSVGAVTATVVSSDGSVLHSGGSLRRADGLVTFRLIGFGTEYAPEGVPPSGTAGWVPGTVTLVKRELLTEFPIDEQMAAYFEDNEWCYRISLAHPGSFRRSREALAFHQTISHSPLGTSWAAIRHRVGLLAAATRFYERHGALLAPSVLDLLPELWAQDGTYDFAAARILMELLAAKGSEWVTEKWARGELTALVDGRNRAPRTDVELGQAYASLRDRQAALEDAHVALRDAHAELGDAHAALRDAHAQLGNTQAELEQLRRAVAAQEQAMEFLRVRHEILCRIEQGGWWRLRGQVLPLVRVAGAVRRRLNGPGNGGRSPRP